MGNIVAIDPGSIESAFVILRDNGEVIEKRKIDNISLLNLLSGGMFWSVDVRGTPIVIEYIRARGMPMSNDSLDTVFWTGRFIQAVYNRDPVTPFTLIDRKDVKMFCCGSSRAKDSNIRAALINHYPSTGGGKIKQVGTTKAPGPLFGVSADIWSALAVGLTYLGRVRGVDCLQSLI